MGKKTQQNFLYLDVSKVQRQDPKQVLLLPAYMSLSLLCVIHKCACVLMRNTAPLFILFLSLDFYPNKSTPPNLLG